MQGIFSKYGKVIVVVMAVVALIGVLTMTVGGPNGGWIGGAFKSVVTDTTDTAGAKIDSIGGSGSGSSSSDYDGLPVFVNSIEECTDTSKKYVLPDGYIYEYIPIETEGELINVIDEVGYSNNTRLSTSDGSTKTQSGYVTTGLIDISNESNPVVITTSGVDFSQSYSAFCTYTEDGTNYGKMLIASIPGMGSDILTSSLDSNGNLTLTIKTSVDSRNARFKICGYGSGENLFVNINGKTNSSITEEYSWQKTEEYVPADWHTEVMNAELTLDNLKTETSSNVTQFLLTSDIHYTGYSTMIKHTKNIGKVSAEVMRYNNIPFFMNVGDSVSSDTTQNLSDQKQQINKVINNVLSPIPNKNILLTVGNHDGAIGEKEVDGEALEYCYQLNNEERAEVFFDWQKSSNIKKKFGPDGTYYYIDDSNTKTRYIMLNSFWNEWEGDEDGFVTDIQHSFYHNALFGQEQLSWFANEALNMPSGYSAVIGTHTVNKNRAGFPKDIDVLSGIISAYKNKTTYTGSYTSTYDWQSSSISIDYSSAKGDLIAIFTGHDHQDCTTTDFAVPVISITTAGAYWDVRDENTSERVAGTATETAIDVVTIDKENRVINLTRLGVGEDRVVHY